MINLVTLATRRASLALRVAMLTTAAVALTFALFSTLIYFVVRTELENSLDASMLRRTSSAVESGVGPNSIANNAVALSLSDMEIGVVRAGRLFESPSDDNTQILRHVVGLPEIKVSQGNKSSSARSVRYEGTRYRVVAVPGPNGTAVVMLQSLEPVDAALDHLRFVLLITGLAGMVAAGVVGWLVATNGLRPVRRLTAAAERVARTTELDPIEVTGRDELARLTASFNHMLAALGAAQERERQLVADAGHELRTPLTSLRTNIELLSQSMASGRTLAETERDALLADISGQVGELSTLVGDLVELAREDPMPVVPEDLDLRDIVEAALDRVRRRAPGLTFDVDLEPWFVLGEQRSLERAVLNLLDNAAKWSPVAGTVRVALTNGDLVVSDEGPGISADDLPHVFDRFYRSDEARALPGSGLGLAIVKHAAERHGGSVRIASVAGAGTTVTFAVPGGTLPPHRPISTDPQ